MTYANGYKYYFSGAAGSLIQQRGAPQVPVADVSLARGWNWIGHAPLVSYYINSVVTDVNKPFSFDDQIKTRSGNSAPFVTYSGSLFEGSLVKFTPGEGYEVKVSRALSFGYTGLTSPPPLPPSPPPPSPSPN